MVFLAFLLLVVLSLSHWLFTPMLRVLTPLLSLAWLGWLLLALAVWLFSGPGHEEPPSPPKSEL